MHQEKGLEKLPSKSNALREWFLNTYFTFQLFFQPGALGTMPNLRSLRLNVDGKVPGFNLASLLYGNPALQTLHIHLIGDAIRGAGHEADVQGSGTALRHELQDSNLPARLKNIIIQGPRIENIHPAAFKVRLNLKSKKSIHNDSKFT